MNINANTAMEIIKIVIAAGVASWGIREYYYKDHLSKVDRAQSYISEHVNIAQIKTDVDDFWVQNIKIFEFKQDQNLILDITHRRFKEETYENIENILTDEKNSDIRKKVHYLQHFYYNVSVCLNDQLCDLETICDGFFGDILAYRLIHIDYLDQFEKAMLSNKDTQIRSLLQKCEQRLPQGRRKQTAVNTATQQ